MGISFGPGGHSESWGKRKFPQDLPNYLAELGLNGFEVECGRGVRIAAKTVELLPTIAEEHGLFITLHAPYYISLSSEKEETRDKSIGYILQSARAADSIGAKKIVVHSGSCGKMTREQGMAYAVDTLSRAMVALDEEKLSHITVCPETMGKINQLGTLEEVIRLCQIDERIIPCIDFGHLNARTHGGIKTKEDYANILDEIENQLGFHRLANMHVHFSKIEYTQGGEKRHLNFDDEIFGPEFEPLMEEIARRNLTPSIICESAGRQAEDASEMARYYRMCK